MPILSPVLRFWVAVITTIAIGISQGTLSLTHAIPDQFIPATTAWFGIIAFISSAVTAATSAAGLTNANRIASASSIPEVQNIQVSPALSEIADAHANVNVVGH